MVSGNTVEWCAVKHPQELARLVSPWGKNLFHFIVSFFHHGAPWKQQKAACFVEVEWKWKGLPLGWGGRQDGLHNFQDPVKNESMGGFAQNLLKISKWRQQNIKNA